MVVMGSVDHNLQYQRAIRLARYSGHLHYGVSSFLNPLYSYPLADTYVQFRYAKGGAAGYQPELQAPKEATGKTFAAGFLSFGVSK